MEKYFTDQLVASPGAITDNIFFGTKTYDAAIDKLKDNGSVGRKQARYLNRIKKNLTRNRARALNSRR